MKHHQSTDILVYIFQTWHTTISSVRIQIQGGGGGKFLSHNDADCWRRLYQCLFSDFGRYTNCVCVRMRVV